MTLNNTSLLQEMVLQWYTFTYSTIVNNYHIYIYTKKVAMVVSEIQFISTKDVNTWYFLK